MKPALRNLNQLFTKIPFYYALFFLYIAALTYFLILSSQANGESPESVAPVVFLSEVLLLGHLIAYAFIALKNKTHGLIALAFACLFVVYASLRLAEAFFLLGIPFFIIFYLMQNKYLDEYEFIQIKLSNRIEEMNARRIALNSEYVRKREHIDGTEKRLGRYLELTQMMESLNSVLSVRDVSNIILEKTFELVADAGRTVMYLIDEDRQNIYPINYRRRDFKGRASAIKGDIYDFWTLQHEKALIVQDADDDFRFSMQESGKVYGVRSVLVVPIFSEAKLIGLLRVDEAKPNVFTQDDLRLLDIIASLSAVALQNAILYERMDDLSKKDGLTGLYLRRFFEKELGRYIQEALENEKPLACVMMDIDYFKKYNDKFGHVAGDTLLRSISDIIRSQIRKNDIACRYGGEEFVCVLKDMPFDGACKFAENIRKSIETRKFQLRRQNTRATISVGVSMLNVKNPSGRELLRAADSRLYEAKDSGRNKICI